MSKKKSAKKAPKPIPVTASARKGACAAGTMRQKSQRAARESCGAKTDDARAFGSLGGKANAIATGKFKYIAGQLVKVS